MFIQGKQDSTPTKPLGIVEPVSPVANLVHPVKKECLNGVCSDLAERPSKKAYGSRKLGSD